MLTVWYARSSVARRVIIRGVVGLLMLGLVVTISVLVHNAGIYFLVVAAMFLSALYGSLRSTSTWLAARHTLAQRYRLAWLSARRRAIYTRIDLAASQQVIETVREARSHWSPN